MKRFNYDGNLIPTESRKFSCGITKINGEIGNSEDDNFYMKISNGYLSKIDMFVGTNRLNGEDYVIMRGKGKEEKENTIQCFRWLADELEKSKGNQFN